MNDNKPICKIFTDGSRAWYLNGKLHREGGPAIKYLNGTKLWYLNGECHSEDGPAIECPGGFKNWYLNGIQYETEEGYWKELFKRGLISEKELFLKLL